MDFESLKRGAYMAATDQSALTVHDVNLKDVSRFGLQGVVNHYKQLTFYVGEHGPFTKEWLTQDFSAVAAKKAMDDQVAELRLITGAK
jgi:uncharacterized protein (DUF1786 family)